MSKLLDKTTPTVETLAKKHNVSVIEIKKQLMRGIKVEKEHTNNVKVAREIALDHIGEKLDYYKKLAKIEEETGISGVRGLGNVTGDPAIGVNNYCNTNTMAYEDQNGNNLEWIKKKHIQYHNSKIGFNFFNPTDIKDSKNFMSEGISAGPEREISIIGDPTGTSRKVSKVEEDEDPCWKGYKMVGMKKKKGKTVPNCVPKEQVSDPRYTERPTLEQNKYPDTTERGIYEDWQKVNRKDKTDGLSQAAVNAYRREHPGSKLKTAVTEKNPTGKRASRRKSFCSRMGGMKKRLTSAKTARDPDSNINKALRRWNCEEEHKYNNITTFIREQLSMKKPLDEIAVDLPPNIQSPPAHYQAAPAKQFSRPVRNVTSRMGPGAGARTAGVQVQRAAPMRSISSRFGGQGGSMTAQVQTQRAAPMRGITSTMPSRGSGGSSAMNAKPTVSAGGLNKSEFMGRSMGSKMSDGISSVARKMSTGFVPKVAGAAAGRAVGALGGVAGAVATTVGPELGKMAQASHKAGHQSFKPHGDEGEKASTVFARMKQPSQGRSIDQYEKDVLTPKKTETPSYPKADVPTPPSRPEYMTRGSAFKAARGEAGGGEGKFSYQSGSDTTPKTYQTNVKDRPEPYKPESQLKQTSVRESIHTIHEVKQMETKELINEAIENIVDNDLITMKENLMIALQEKAMEKLEERKKIIASEYFAQ